MSRLEDHSTPKEYVAFELGEAAADAWFLLLDGVAALDAVAGAFLNRFTEHIPINFSRVPHRETDLHEICEIASLDLYVDNDEDFEGLRQIWSLLQNAAVSAGIDRIKVIHIEEGISLLLLDPASGRGWDPSPEFIREAAAKFRARLVPPALSETPMKQIDGFELTPIEAPVYEYLKETKLLFSPQCRIVAQGRVRYRIDFLIWYQGRSFALELDGHEAHKSRNARGRDAQRDRYLLQRGITPIRFTGSQVHSDLYGCMMELVDVLTGKRSSEF